MDSFLKEDEMPLFRHFSSGNCKKHFLGLNVKKIYEFANQRNITFQDFLKNFVLIFGHSLNFIPYFSQHSPKF